MSNAKQAERRHALDPSPLGINRRWPLCGHFGETRIVNDLDEVDCKHCLRKLGRVIPAKQALINAVLEWHASYVRDDAAVAREARLCAAVDAYLNR